MCTRTAIRNCQGYAANKLAFERLLLGIELPTEQPRIAVQRNLKEANGSAGSTGLIIDSMPDGEPSPHNRAIWPKPED
jgi:hypothetical protein